MQSKINWETGNKHSHSPVEKTCVDCGHDFYTSVNARSRVTRCPRCAEEHREEMHLLRQHKKNPIGQRGSWGRGHQSNYKVILDPSESWGFESCLGRQEISTMLKSAYLENGTMFLRLTDGRRFWVYMTTLREVTT